MRHGPYSSYKSVKILRKIADVYGDSIGDNY